MRKYKICFFIVIMFLSNMIFPSIIDNRIKAIKKIENKIKSNPEVKEVQVLDLYGDLTDKWELVITTRDGNSLIVYDVEDSLKNKEMKVFSINDLCSRGGNCVNKKNKATFAPRNLISLSVLTGLKLKNINDLINNRDVIYKIFKAQFENQNQNKVIETELYSITMYVYEFEIDKYIEQKKEMDNLY